MAAGLTEEKTRTLIEALARECLAAQDRDLPLCKQIAGSDKGFLEQLAQTLIRYLGEIAEPSVAPSSSVRLLVRLSGRGAWQAEMALERILVRRAEASLGPCSPPSDPEIAAASTSLKGFVVIEAPASPKGAWAVHEPTQTELPDLAYFYAAVATNGPAVGETVEDTSSTTPKPNDPAVTDRRALADQLKAALFDGDLEAHAKLADRYLHTLGFPGPIRAHEDLDARWGGAGFSYVIRDAARSEELLGHDAVAAALYRRAQPGGGMCGTSTASRRDGQIAGVIRATERATGCRAALAERLFAVDLSPEAGPARLERAGFDLARLYRGALLTTNRSERADIERALSSAPSLAVEAQSRLARLGNEAWAVRVRAIPGYADSAKKKAVDRLLGVAERGASADRVDAVNTIGRLVQDKGYDPCDKATTHGWGESSSGDRQVISLTHRCEDSLDAAERKKLVSRLAALRGSPDPELRTAVAKALGRTGALAAKPLLGPMKSDVFDAGGQVCTSRGSKPAVCTPNRPVKLAAEEALEAIDEAEATRKESRKAAADPKKP